MSVGSGYDLMFIRLWGTGHDLWLIYQHALRLRVDEQMIIIMFLRPTILFSLKKHFPSPLVR
jgi:hypothetical protein